MSEPFSNEMLSFSPIPPGFHVRVRHTEYLPGETAKTTERYEFPVIGWATVRLTGSGLTFLEAVFLWSGDPVNTSEYRRVWSDLTPDPGEPKRTVGIDVVHPEESR